MSDVDILISATDQASSTLESVGDTGEEAGHSIEKGFAVAGAACVAAGMAAEGLARKFAEMVEDTSKLAAVTDLNTESMRGLVLETWDVTRPLDEVLSMFEMARQQGEKSGPALKAYAIYWDTIGDAIGSSGPILAEAGLNLAILGIDIDNYTDSLDALGFMQRDTTLGTKGFMQLAGKLGVEIDEAGMSFDDFVLIVAKLSEKFTDAKSLSKKFRESLEEAGNSTEKMKAIVGLTAGEQERLNAEIATGSDYIEEGARIHGESYTLMQDIELEIAKLGYKYSWLSDILSVLGPIISGVGTAFLLLAGAKFLNVKATAASIIAHTIEGAKIILCTAAVVAHKIATWAVTVATAAWAALTSGTLIPTLAAAAASAGVTALAIGGVTAAFALLALSVWGAVKAYQGYAEAREEHLEALDRELEGVKDQYEAGVDVRAYYEDPDLAIDPIWRRAVLKYIEELEKAPPSGKIGTSGAGPVSETETLGGAGAGAGGSGGPVVHEHKFTTPLRIEGVNDKGDAVFIVDVVMDELRRDLRGAAH